MAPLNSFILQYLVITSSTFVFKNENMTLKNIFLIANLTRFTLIYKNHLHNTTSKCRYVQSQYQLRTFLIFKNDFKMRNFKSFFQQIFIVYKTFTVGIKTKNPPRTTRFCLWLLYRGALNLSKMTFFEWSQESLSYTGLAVLLHCWKLQQSGHHVLRYI